MTNILKQFAGSVTHLRQSEFEWATIKLTLFYVFSTFVILLVSSVAIIVLFAPPETGPVFISHERQEEVSFLFSLYELRDDLPSVIAFVDVLVLLIVSILSYYFARRTLAPIKDNQDRQLQFMSNVAHELRTPLSVMRSGAETMLRRDHSAEEYRDFVGDVKEESVRLARLSNQLLQLLRLGSVAMVEKVKLDLAKEVKREVQKFAAYAKEHEVELSFVDTEDVELAMEPGSFIQLLQNLIKNAIDYSEPGDEVKVALSEDNEAVTLVVSDKGIGIPEHKQQEIFSRFAKLDAARSHFNDTGAGLGLAIVEEIVLRHNGHIDLKSVEGEGTTVTIKLPK